MDRYYLNTCIDVMYTSMNYYMIPTKYMELPLTSDFTNVECIEPHISCSYYRNIKSLKLQVESFISHTKKEVSSEQLQNIHNINNPYSFLYSVIDSNVTPFYSDTEGSDDRFQLFFVLIELCNTFDFLQKELYQYPMHTIYVGKNGKSFSKRNKLYI